MYFCIMDGMLSSNIFTIPSLYLVLSSSKQSWNIYSTKRSNLSDMSPMEYSCICQVTFSIKASVIADFILSVLSFPRISIIFIQSSMENSYLIPVEPNPPSPRSVSSSSSTNAKGRRSARCIFIWHILSPLRTLNGASLLFTKQAETSPL